MIENKKHRPRRPPKPQLEAPAGHLFILSAPSGAGKTTLCQAILDRFYDMLYSVSYTTRKPRGGEADGVAYHFIAANDFEKGIKDGRWAEWAEVHGHYYGTSAEFLDNGLASGSDILLDIDVQGTIQILERYPDSITVFILPPSLEVLQRRLRERGTDSSEAIARRLHNARKEIANKDLYRHVVVNDKLEDAVDKLAQIIQKYR